jgi:hypothetical protein
LGAVTLICPFSSCPFNKAGFSTPYALSRHLTNVHLGSQQRESKPSQAEPAAQRKNNTVDGSSNAKPSVVTNASQLNYPNHGSGSVTGTGMAMGYSMPGMGTGHGQDGDFAARRKPPPPPAPRPVPAKPRAAQAPAPEPKGNFTCTSPGCLFYTKGFSTAAARDAHWQNMHSDNSKPTPPVIREESTPKPFFCMTPTCVAYGRAMTPDTVLRWHKRTFPLHIVTSAPFPYNVGRQRPGIVSADPAADYGLPRITTPNYICPVSSCAFHSNGFSKFETLSSHFETQHPKWFPPLESQYNSIAKPKVGLGYRTPPQQVPEYQLRSGAYGPVPGKRPSFRNEILEFIGFRGGNQ